MQMFEDYLANIPMMHSWDGGATWNTGGFSDWHLRQMYDLIRARHPNGGAVIGETGAGNSSLTFLFTDPKEVWAVAPEFDLGERIKTYARDHGLPLDRWSYYVDISEVMLPQLALKQETPELDFALIDGGHGYPTVFIDLVYMNYMLKPGGLLMMDDVNLYSVREAVRMLKMQPGWKLVANLQKSLVFEKQTDERRFPEFNQQPYIMHHVALDDFTPSN